MDLRHNNIRFRPTTINDIDTIISIEQDAANTPYIRQWSREKRLKAINDTNIAHFTIEEIDADNIVGYVILIGVEDPDNNLEFKRLAIKAKGKGYGRSAVKLIKQFAFQFTETHRLWLEVVEYNERARKLYESEGFIPEGV
ncbi:MAG: GNAT family N-acetyltransferase, partial [Candidatus Zixiibacteriota bacterium]